MHCNVCEVDRVGEGVERRGENSSEGARLFSWKLRRDMPSHTFSFSVHLTNITAHQSLIFLSESLVTENKLKSSFSKLIAFGHSWLDTEPELTLDWLPLLNTPEGWQRSAEAVWEGNAPLKSCSEICYETCSLSMSKSYETYTSMP